jgi:hypothetical protein
MDWRSSDNRVLPEDLQPGDRVRDLDRDHDCCEAEVIGVDRIEVDGHGRVLVYHSGGAAIALYQAGYGGLRYDQ